VPNNEERVFQAAFAIAYAENECVETKFPSGNPVSGAPELVIGNPLTPLDPQSFWSETMKPFCTSVSSPTVAGLIKAVDQLFAEWKAIFRNRAEVPISKKPYFLSAEGLTVGAGLIQIKDFARETNNAALLQRFTEIQTRLKSAKKEFFDLSTSSQGFDYFGSHKKNPSSVRLPMESNRRVTG
jgi:hypothetical protein